MSNAVVELSCAMRWQRYMDWLFISMLQGPAVLTVDNSGISVVWQCSYFVEGIVIAGMHLYVG